MRELIVVSLCYTFVRDMANEFENILVQNISVHYVVTLPRWHRNDRA